jgi:hypothetical protein
MVNDEVSTKIRRIPGGNCRLNRIIKPANSKVLESPFSVSFYAYDKLNQFLPQNDEILTRVNDWLYHYRLI